MKALYSAELAYFSSALSGLALVEMCVAQGTCLGLQSGSAVLWGSASRLPIENRQMWRGKRSCRGTNKKTDIMGVLPRHAVCSPFIDIMKTAEDSLLRFSLPFLGHPRHPAFQNFPFWGLSIVRIFWAFLEHVRDVCREEETPRQLSLLCILAPAPKFHASFHKLKLKGKLEELKQNTTFSSGYSFSSSFTSPKTGSWLLQMPWGAWKCSFGISFVLRPQSCMAAKGNS